MRHILTAFFILIFGSAFSQQIQYIGGANSRVVARNEFEATNLFIVPNRADTTFSPDKAGALIFRTADKRMYLYDGTVWRLLHDNFTSTWVDEISVIDDSTLRVIKSGDTTDIVINGKEDVPPTFHTDAINDTTLRFVYNNDTVEVEVKGRSVSAISSISRSRDSVFFTLDGVKTFAFKDSIGNATQATATNVGTGAGIYKQQSSGQIQLRSILSANGNLGLTQNTNDILLTAKSFIDSVRKSSDSVYFYKDGSATFAFKDSSGAGSSTDTSSLSNRINALNTRIDTTVSVELDSVLFAGVGSPADPFVPKTFTVSTLADLKAYNGANKYFARIEGQNTVGDKGARNFRWVDTSTATPDDVLIVQPTSGGMGRWVAVPEDGEYPARWWGLTGDIGAKANTIINAVPSGSTIEFPKDSYTLTTEITVNKPVTINFNNSTIERDGTTGNFISVQSSNVSLYNLYMNGQYTDTVYTGGQLNNFIETDGATNEDPYTNLHFENIHAKIYKNSGFWLKYVDGFKVINCSVDSVPYSGFMMLSAKNGYFENIKGSNFRGVYVGDSTSINAYGMAFSKSSTSDYNSDNNTVNGAEFRDNRWWEMIDTHGADNLIFNNVRIFDAYKGIAIVYYESDGSKNININNVYVDNSNITDADAGIQIQGEDDTDFSSGQITNSILIGSGIAMANTKGFIVNNVTIDHPSLGFGVLLKNNNRSFQVTNVTVYDVWNSDGTGNNAALKTYTGENVGYVSGLKLRRGSFTPPTGYGTYLNWYGIRPNNETKSNKIVIGPGCDFKDAQNKYGNTYALVFDQSTNLNRKRYTDSFTVLLDDQEISYENAIGGDTATLPALDSVYHRRRFRINNTSSGTLALSLPYYETYGGTAKTSIPAKTSVEFYSDSAFNVYFGRPTILEGEIPFNDQFTDSLGVVTLTGINARNGAEDKAMIFNPGSEKYESIKVYTKSLLDLLYVTDTLGVKVVRSFHEGYNTGGFSVRYVPGGTPDYVTSWPSKVYTGIWERIDYSGDVEIEKIGALGTRNTQVTAATLGYDDTELTDLFGTYFTKATTDYIDQIALNQMIKSYSVGYRSFKLEPEQEYRFNSKLEEWPYHSSNNYQELKIVGSNSSIRSIGGKYTAFWRYPLNSTVANTLVHSKYVIRGLKFVDCDTAVAIHPSYRSIIDDNNFYNCRYGLVLRWDMAANVTNNNFSSTDSIGLAIWRFEGVFTGNPPQSNYVVGTNNRFESGSDTKRNIDVYKSNGIVFEQTIFEGSNPDYNLYIDYTGGNAREIKFESVHCENIPDSAHIYFRGRASKLYLKKWYLQTDAVTIDAGSIAADGVSVDESNPVQVSFEDIPYWGGIPSFRHSGGASWVFKNCAFIDVNSATNWYGGVIPADIDAGFMAGSYKNAGVLTSIKGGIDVYSMKVFDGSSVFNKTLRVPVYTDSTTEAANDGRLMFQKDRSKLYYGQSTSWRWLLDSVGFLNKASIATANSQTLYASVYSPTFSDAGFTGINAGFANHTAAWSGKTIEYRLSNTSATASSQTKLTLHAGVASGTAGAGLTEIYNSGLFSSAITDITLRTSTAGKSIYFQPSGTTKGTFSSTGLRIGDATAPTVAFEIGSTGAMLLPKGTTAQRPTGVAGYLRSNSDSTAPEFHDGTNWNRVSTAQALRDTAAQIRAAITSASATRSLVKVNDADYTIASGTGDITVVYFDALTAGRTVTLPSAATNTGRRITIKHGGSGSFDLTTSVSMYENATTTTTTITQGTWVSLESDGTNWVIVAK